MYKIIVYLIMDKRPDNGDIMTATDILMQALDATVGETNQRGMDILEVAIRLAIPLIRNESLDAYNEGENDGATGRLYSR